MSDLQCAATLVLVAPAEPSRAVALGGQLAGRRIAAVWTGGGAPELATAELVAAALGLPVTARPGPGDPGPGADDPATPGYRGWLQEIADLHRGETVLVVLPGLGTGSALPPLADNVTAGWAGRHRLRPGDTVELTVDGDGWVITQWAGVTPA